jgi:hypothetical protein
MIIKRSFFVACILCSIHLNTLAQKNWREVLSVEQVCEYYPDVVIRMLNQFDLDHQGLEEVKAAYDRGHIVEACKHLLDYYKNGDNAQDLRRQTPLRTTKTDADADTILNNVFVIQNVRGQVGYGADGHRDWYYKGPNNDREWAWLSNRHSQLAKVFSTYLETGNPKYAEYIDLFLRDFIIKSMPYPEAKGSESIWRGLEVAARAKVWSRIFYGLISCEYIAPSTQLFILSSLPDHAHYNRNFHSGNNWLTMEISALATIAAYFPEYKSSEEWMAYSIDTMTASMKEQVYPDGVQTELTSHYHNVALSNFELFKGICDLAGQSLPEYYNQTLEKMYSYIAHVVRPSGYRILNNDGDRGSDRDYILQGAKKFDRPEWEYIATNGKSGNKPSDGPSYFYPWAGHFVSRSGFDSQAHWSFFDMGPWGSGHQHNDKLHISIAAYDRDLLVDAGRFAYTGAVAEKFRSYARSTAGHNALLIDNKGQEAGPTHALEPLGKNDFKISSDMDYASGSFDHFTSIVGVAKHIRSIFYVRGEFWVVVDRIITDRPRTIDALWHWHPDNNVVRNRRVVKTNNAHGNLAVIPISKKRYKLELVKGQEEPEIQGWYSPEYNIYGPNTTSIYRTEISATTNLVWLLLPSESKLPKVKAKVLEENEQEVRIEVKSKERMWALTIPFMNSEGAVLTEN